MPKLNSPSSRKAQPVDRHRAWQLLFSAMLPNKTEAEGQLSGFEWEQCDWSLVTELAHTHRLVPLLFFFLNRRDDLGRVPNPYHDWMTKAYHQSLARAITLQDRYESLSCIFRKHGIEHKPLRGIEWARTLYENPGLRPMSDIDVIVAPHCREDAGRILIENGYVCAAKADRRGCHDLYHKSQVAVELHFRLTTMFVLALFPDFDWSGEMPALECLGGKPYAALHYWIKAQRPALWACDYARLPTLSKSSFSRQTQQLMLRTEFILKEAAAGRAAYLFGDLRRPILFWLNTIAGIWLRTLSKNPSATLHLSRELLDWQLWRIGRKARKQV